MVLENDKGENLVHENKYSNELLNRLWKRPEITLVQKNPPATGRRRSTKTYAEVIRNVEEIQPQDTVEEREKKYQVKSLGRQRQIQEKSHCQR